MSELPSVEELEEELYYLVRPARVIRLARYRLQVLKAAADVAYEHCLWMDRHAVGDKILKVGETYNKEK